MFQRSDPAAALVFREFSHRVANAFASLSMTLQCDLMKCDESQLRDALARHERQMRNFGKLLRPLAMRGVDCEISAESYFKPFIEVLASSILTPIGVRCEVFIADDLLSSTKCEQLALIMAELVVNAARYSFRKSPGGVVRIAIVGDNDGWICSVSADGDGGKIRSEGSSSEMLDALITMLGGTIVIHSGKWGSQAVVAFI